MSARAFLGRCGHTWHTPTKKQSSDGVADAMVHGNTDGHPYFWSGKKTHTQPISDIIIEFCMANQYASISCVRVHETEIPNIIGCIKLLRAQKEKISTLVFESTNISTENCVSKRYACTGNSNFQMLWKFCLLDTFMNHKYIKQNASFASVKKYHLLNLETVLRMGSHLDTTNLEY